MIPRRAATPKIAAAEGMTMQEKQQLLLVDGSGYIFRAFHALPPMSRKDGTPVNAVYGFTAMLMKLVDDIQPDHVAVVFDMARKTFRSDIFPEYKANRPPCTSHAPRPAPRLRAAEHPLAAQAKAVGRRRTQHRWLEHAAHRADHRARAVQGGARRRPRARRRRRVNKMDRA